MQSCFHQLLSRFGHLDSRIAHEAQHSVVKFSGTDQIAGRQRNVIDTAAGHSSPPKRVPTARSRIKYPIQNAEESEWGNLLSSGDQGSARASDSTRLSPLRDCALTATPRA